MSQQLAENVNGLRAKSLESQSQFRIILDALSHPGKEYHLNKVIDGSKSKGAMNALINALCDYEISFFFHSEFESTASSDWFRYSLKIKPIDSVHTADFVAVPAGWINDLELSSLNMGCVESPHLGSTLFIEVESFEAIENAVNLSATGPGIETKVCFSVQGLNRNFWQQRIDLQREFPIGLDIIFCCGSQIIALPRSSRIEMES